MSDALTLPLKARSMMNEAIEIAGTLLVLAIPVGAIAVPVFISVNTTGWSTTNLLVWGTILTVAFASIIMLMISRFRRATGN